MKTIIASLFAVALLGATAANAGVGIQVGPVGIGVGGHYYWHHHYWHHRAWRGHHWHYW